MLLFEPFSCGRSHFHGRICHVFCDTRISSIVLGHPRMLGFLVPKLARKVQHERPILFICLFIGVMAIVSGS